MRSDRKTIIKKISEFEKSRTSTNEYIKKKYINDKGKFQIDINLTDREEMYNPLSTGVNRDLDESVYGFINSKASLIPLNREVEIFVHSEFKMTDSEKKNISDMIENHYLINLREKNKEIRMNIIKTTYLAVVGVSLLSLYLYLQIGKERQIFTEFLSIAGTFSLWEAVNQYLLIRKKLKIEKLEAGQIAMAEVIYDEVQ